MVSFDHLTNIVFREDLIEFSRPENFISCIIQTINVFSGLYPSSVDYTIKSQRIEGWIFFCLHVSKGTASTLLDQVSIFVQVGLSDTTEQVLPLMTPEDEGTKRVFRYCNQMTTVGTWKK